MSKALVNCVLLPVSHGHVLIPNTAVASMISFTPGTAAGCAALAAGHDQLAGLVPAGRQLVRDPRS